MSFNTEISTGGHCSGAQSANVFLSLISSQKLRLYLRGNAVSYSHFLFNQSHLYSQLVVRKITFSLPHEENGNVPEMARGLTGGAVARML